MSFQSAPWLKKSIRLLLWLIVFVCFYALVIEWLFQKKKSKAPYAAEYWSHRGNNSVQLPENTIHSFEYVLKFGVTGIETDVFWDEGKKTFIVTHDPPQQGFVYPTLEEITARFKDSINYWIDFKNLNAKNQKNAETALNLISKKYGLYNKLYVESSNGFLLSRFNSDSIKKIYWLQYSRNFLIKPIKLLYIKSLIVFGGFDGFTCAFRLYDNDFKNQFGGLPLYLFHSPANAIEKEAKTPSSIKVQLVDADYLQLIKR